MTSSYSKIQLSCQCATQDTTLPSIYYKHQMDRKGKGSHISRQKWPVSTSAKCHSLVPSPFLMSKLSKYLETSNVCFFWSTHMVEHSLNWINRLVQQSTAEVYCFSQTLQNIDNHSSKVTSKSKISVIQSVYSWMPLLSGNPSSGQYP